MVNMYYLAIKRYVMGGDGEPSEEYLVDNIQDSSLEMMVKRWQNYEYQHKLHKRAGEIDYMGAEELSTIRLVLFKVYI